ncbi:MAG: hypothetical protein R2712_21735 [Vicinamibacterales bacterium]
MVSSTETEDVGLEHLSHRRHIERADLGAAGVAGVVDEHVDAAHAGLAFRHQALVVGGGCHIGMHGVRAGLGRDRREQVVVAPGDDHLVAGLACLCGEGGADALAAARDEETSWLHGHHPIASPGVGGPRRGRVGLHFVLPSSFAGGFSRFKNAAAETL